MHELAVCQGLMLEVERVARAHDAEAVDKIIVLLGPLSGAEPDLLQRAFEVARAGTVAANAELLVEADEVRVACASCGGEGPAAPNKLLCPACGDWRVRVVSGEALMLKSVELRRATAPGAGGAAAAAA